MKQATVFIIAAASMMACATAALAQRPTVVNDVTQLNPVPVARIVTPETLDELRSIVAHNDGPVSIAGGRYSMGGQTALRDSLHIDMRRLNRVLHFSAKERVITVQAGATWRELQEFIDPYDLAIKIMQSYANFTVGGSLSVNVHGRYVGEGPVVRSVRAIKVVLADGRVVTASRSENRDIFDACIGGYGGIGVIAEATLDLAENTKVERIVRRMPFSQYRKYFFSRVRSSPKAVFHNADLYPPTFDTVNAITYRRTSKPLTVYDRLVPRDKSYAFERFMMWGVSELPFGRQFRATVLDPFRYRGEQVLYRNYEASYDVAELEPRSRKDATYVLQEYFVPVERLEQFVPRMSEIFHRYDVNVVNVSIRHAKSDDETKLAWAKGETFALVVYYKQGTKRHQRTAVGVWTRELIERAIELGGGYYLPYQPHATPVQFHKAYPRADEYFAIKARFDPRTKFLNTLWAKYLPRTLRIARPSTRLPSGFRKVTLTYPHYVRREEQTFLTLPEWYIVFSADEYASHVRERSPSTFPFFASIDRFWSTYSAVRTATSGRYPFNWAYHVMIGVIGASYSVEYLGKGLYENTIGRLSEWVCGYAGGRPPTVQDRFMAKVAKDYGDFVHVEPWYDFPFGRRLVELWSLPAARGESAFRAVERTLGGTVELAVKTAWAWVIRTATQAAYDPEQLRIAAVVSGSESIDSGSGVRTERRIAPDLRLVSIPRYEPFTGAVAALSRAKVRLVEVAGQTNILLTVVAPNGWEGASTWGEVVAEWPILTRPGWKRTAIFVPVSSLARMVAELDREKIVLDHVFDY